jgi:1,4-alpha-glucan branching enzyme
VTFRLLAPAAQNVYIGGTFNNFDATQHPLKQNADGVWETTLQLPLGPCLYKFKVDGQWELDPTNPEKTPAPREASLLDVAP